MVAKTKKAAAGGTGGVRNKGTFWSKTKPGLDGDLGKLPLSNHFSKRSGVLSSIKTTMNTDISVYSHSSVERLSFES